MLFFLVSFVISISAYFLHGFPLQTSVFLIFLIFKTYFCSEPLFLCVCIWHLVCQHMTCSVTSWMRCRFYWKAPRLWIFPSPLSSLRDTDMHRLLCYLKSGWRLAFYKEMRSRALRIPELHRNIFRSGMTGGHAPERGSSRGATSHAPRCLQTGGRSWQMTKKQGKLPGCFHARPGNSESTCMSRSSLCDLT